MICPMCLGKGYATDEDIKEYPHRCPNCNGKGFYSVDWQKVRCEVCNGSGKKPMTNFEWLTESPEALAKWICEFTDFCDRGCSHCPVQEKCLYDSDGAGNKDNEQLLIEFLKEDVNCWEK